MIIDVFYKLKYTVYMAGQAKRNDYQFVAADVVALQEVVSMSRTRTKKPIPVGYQFPIIICSKFLPPNVAEEEVIACPPGL